MANAYARYTERVAAAGKRAYPLPMYVNAALPRPNAAPGSGYPAAGTLPKLAAIWRTGAPSLDFLAPAIYFPNFVAETGRASCRGRMCQSVLVSGVPVHLKKINAYYTSSTDLL